ncbi:ABC transporter ATP-binding protein [uncultured Helcococcus sp.]|uniref:ABC transporter ATP-binding protein n=1 Tax=uncultured Helcococcus sp. TaxID=1072508 RepID=UPI0026367ABF|nr:ABC transporter ATP-binding protein [uncultured Helcococcus sp.]
MKRQERFINKYIKVDGKGNKYIGFNISNNTFNMKIKYIIGSLTLILASLISVYIPYLVSLIVDNIDNVLNFMDNKILLVILFLFQTILVSVGNISFVNISENKAFEIRENIISSIVYSSEESLDTINVERLPSHLDNNISVIKNFYGRSIPNIISAIVTVIISIYFLFSLDSKLSIVLLTMLPCIMIVVMPISIISGKYSNSFQLENSKYIEKLSNIFNNNIYIKSLNGQKDIIKNLDENSKEIKRYSSKNRKIDSFAQPFLTIFLIAIIAIIFIVGGSRVNQGKISVGVLIAYLLYIFQLLNPISNISYFFSDLNRLKVNKKELQVYEDLAKEDFTENDKKHIGKIDNISFKNVNFSYPKKDYGIEDINLNIGPGEKIALVGDSGAGKSTVFKLLLKLYELKKGNIFINGVDINDINLKSLREKIKLVPQENSIVYSNLEEFLKLGEESLDYESIDKYIKELRLDKALGESSEEYMSYDFKLGAKNLSAGEKQRILILKSLITNFDVLLMDESTSSLDSELENIVFEIIKRDLSDKMILFITHRLSTVKYMDRVIFMENGQITGNDVHENLYKTHKRYKTYIDMQNIERKENIA